MKNQENSKSVVVFSWCVAIFCLVATVVSILTFSARGWLTFAQENDSAFDSRDELAKLQKLVAARNLNAVVAFQRRLDELSGVHDEGIFVVKAEICKQLNSGQYADLRHTLFARQCAKALLKDSDRFSVDLEYDLVRILQELEEYRTGVADQKKWPVDRKERLDKLFHLFSRIRKEYNPNFDFNDRNNIPLTQICIPNSKYRCGADPESIAEPDIREKYRRDIRENRQKVRRWNEQRMLSRIVIKFPDFVDRFITGMFKFGSYDEAEFELEMNRFEINGERRTKIRGAVSQKY